jgi:hypothetical protein
MNIVISSVVVTNIESFYQNVARKYRNTYDYGDMHRDIDNAIDATLRIENGLLRRKPTISRWSGYFMTNTDKWYFAYRIEGETIYVEDACHAQNMHELLEENKMVKLILSFMDRLNKIA